MTTRNSESLWANVHALATLAGTGTFTAAAERLGLSKASMSERIQELERAVGVPLVLRTTRSVRLTDAGRKLVEETGDAFERIAQGVSNAADLASGPRGLVRLTAPVALGRQQIVPRLMPFLRDHPDVRIELDLSDRLVSMAREGFDLAIRHAAAAPDSHVAWRLCRTQSFAVASREYLLRHPAPRTPEALADHACLHYPRPGERAAWTFERTRGGRSPARSVVAVDGVFAANNSEALRDAALSGLGIALLPDFSAVADIRGGRLEVVLPGWRPVGGFGDGLYAIRPYSPQVPRAVQALVEHLRASMKAGFDLR